MISFIVIGRNEGLKLTKCFKSIINTISFNNMKDYEVIYVDSNSTDNSIERAMKFKGIKIFKITSKPNAAIARNIGAKEAKRDILFFIDGDMEIIPEFLPKVFDNNNNLIYPFVSGQLKNFNYCQAGQFINNSWQYNGVMKEDKFYSTTGGIFIIERKLWILVKGMDNRFKRGQDLEICLRLSQKGYKILRKKEIIANHNTVSYTHYSRMWKIIFSGDISYSNSFLLRKHIMNPHIYVKMLKTNYTLATFIILFIAAYIFNNFLILAGYTFVLALKVVKNNEKLIIRNFELFFFYFIRDIFFIIFLFIPIKKINNSDIKYIKID